MAEENSSSAALPTSAEAASVQDPARREAVARDVWGYYRRWAALARKLQSSRRKWRSLVLLLAIAGIVLGPSAKYIAKTHAPLFLPPLITWLSALVVALVAWFNKEILGPGADKKWVKCRELSEWHKSEVYRFLTDALPYGGKEPSLLITKMEEMLKTAPKLPLPELTAEERSEGFPGYPLSIEQFLEKRLEDQIAFFRKNAGENAERARHYRAVGLLLSGLVMLLGVPVPLYFSGVNDWLKDSSQLWVPVINGTAAMLATYISQRRFQFLADEYEMAGRDLSVQRLRWNASAKGDAERKQLVTVCEEILSRQNAAWAKELARDA